MAFSLHNFLLSQKDFSESYGFLCSQIDPSNLNDLVSNLDDLNLSSKFMLPEERFKESKPMENDHAIPYINRLAKGDRVPISQSVTGGSPLARVEAHVKL